MELNEQAVELTPEMMQEEMNILLNKILNPIPNEDCEICERARQRKVNFSVEKNGCFICQMREIIMQQHHKK